LLKTNMFNYVPIKHKEMSFVSNGGKFKFYTVLNGLIFPTSIQPRILFERAIFYLKKEAIIFPHSSMLFSFDWIRIRGKLFFVHFILSLIFFHLFTHVNPFEIKICCKQFVQKFLQCQKQNVASVK
jgi:hypothetical protein